MANGVDIATLGLRVDARQLQQSTAELGRFTQAGAKAEQASNRLSQRVQRNAQRDAAALSSYQRAVSDRLTESDILSAADEYDRRFSGVVETTDKVSKSTRSAGGSIHRLNNSMVVLARTATGTHPVVGQVGDAVGTFAIGTAKMVPILAGIAALGFGFQAMRRRAAEATRELEDNLKVLEDIAEQQRVEDRGGATRIALDAAQAEARRIAVLVRVAQDPVVGNQALVESYTEQLREVNRQIAAGLMELEDEERESRARRRRELLQQQREVEAAAKRHQEELARIAEEERKIKVALTHQRWRQEAGIIAAAQAEREAEEKAFADRIVAIVEETNDRIKREQEERKEAELEAIAELERARRRANRALVRALNNVGRAYGGVIDQVLALASATLSLERLPMESREDRAIAFGTSAAIGAGVGRTSGSPLLGGVGGAAAGFSTAGPIGAIVGGVTGIVSGLIEQGRRMRQAQAVWQQALKDFEALFDPSTRLQQGTSELDDAFRRSVQAAGAAQGIDASGIRSVEDARTTLLGARGSPGLRIPEAFIDSLERLIELYDENAEQLRQQIDLEQQRFGEDLRVRLLRAQGLEEEADKLQQIIEQERELQRARELGFDAATIALLNEVHAQERLARATRETTDELNRTIQALNSPQGLNLALLGYRAGLTGGGIDGGPFIGGTDPGPPNGPSRRDIPVVINVNGARDPKATADEVRRVFDREASRGGPEPLMTVRR